MSQKEKNLCPSGPLTRRELPFWVRGDPKGTEECFDDLGRQEERRNEMRKIIFILTTLCFIFLIFAFTSASDEELKICDIKFKNGKWEKYVILELRSDGVEAIKYDLYKRDSKWPKQFIDKYEIEYVLCDTIYRFIEDDISIRVMKYAEARRDPTLAGILSLLTFCGGQVYNHENKKATIFLGAQSAIALLVFYNEPKELKPLDNPEIAILMLSFIPALSVLDAVESAIRINRELKIKYNISYKKRFDGVFCEMSLNF